MKDMETTIYDCTGLNRADIRTYMLKKYGEDFAYDEFQKTSAAVLSEYLEKEPIPAKDGVYELLEYLKKEGYPIGLASSSRKVNVMTRIEEIHIESYFEKIITGDMVVHSKPDPEIYQIACSEMGVRPQDAIAIEDSPNGIKSAYAAGMKVIMVPDLVQPDADLLGMVWKLFDNLLEVKTYLEKESGQKA